MNSATAKRTALKNDNSGGDDWGDVNVDNDNIGVASLFPSLPLIIVKSNRDRNGGGAGGKGGGASLLPGITKTRTN